MLNINLLIFSLRDIKNNLRVFIIFCIQLIVTFLLLGYTFAQIIDVSGGVKRIYDFNTKSSYAISDTTFKDRVNEILNNESEHIPRMKQLFKVFNDNEIYFSWDYYIGTTTFEEKEIDIEEKIANETFFSMNNFKIIEGVPFDKDDFQTLFNETVPVLVGYNLKNIYKLGQTYSFVNGGNGDDFKGTVIGVLESNSSYPLLREPREENSLDNSYIVPLSNDYIENIASISDLDMGFTSMLLFVDNEEEVINLQNEINKANVFSYKIVPLEKALNAYIEFYRPQLMYQIFISVIIILFAVIGMVSSLSIIVTKNMRDYAVNILYGARSRHIYLRIILQVFLIIMIACIPAACILGISKALLFIIFVGILIESIVLIYPLYKLKHSNIIDVLRQCE